MMTRRVLFIACCLALAVALLPLAAHSSERPTAASMTIEGASVVVRAVPVANFTAMNVRLFNSEGEPVVSVQSTGEAVRWSPGPDDIDGRYRFEAVIVTYDPALDSGIEDGPDGVRLMRSHGRFVVKWGVPTIGEDSRDKSLDNDEGRND